MRLLILFTLLAGGFSAHRPAAAAPHAAEPLPTPVWRDVAIRFERISNEQGLSMSVVQTIAQDRRGFLWFGTQDGLNRYDGYSFRVYKFDPDNPNSLSHNWVTSLLADSQGRLWAATRGGGLNRFDPATGGFIRYIQALNHPDSLSSNNLYSLYEDRQGILWIGSDRGVDRLDPDTGQVETLSANRNAPDWLRTAIVRSVSQDRRGRYWIATNHGLVRASPQLDAFNVYRANPQDPASLSADDVSLVLEDHAGRLWVGTRGGGLDRLTEDGLGFYHLSTQDSAALSSAAIMDLYEDPDGLIWIATWEGGLDRLDPRTGQVDRFLHSDQNPTSLSSNYLHTIFADASGLVWIGTYGGGLSKFDPESEQFRHYFTRPGDPNSLSSNMVWSVLEDGRSLWIGTDAGLDRIDRLTGETTHYRHNPNDPNSLPFNEINLIFQDTRGDLWMAASQGGLSRYDPRRDRFDNFASGAGQSGSRPMLAVTAMAQDRSGELWIGSRQGLHLFDAQRGVLIPYSNDRFTPALPFSEQGVSTMVAAQDGGLWIGARSGLFRFDPAAGTVEPVTIKSDAGPLEAEIMSLYETEDGDLWIGVMGLGLMRYTPQTGAARVYSEKDGLPNATIYGILEDDDGFLWMSTNKGLARFDRSAQTFKTYDARDGLQSNEFNAHAYARSRSGELFFGGINGLSAFHPDAIRENTYKPPVVITSLTQSGVPVGPPGVYEDPLPVELTWPNNFFEFEIAALSFRQPDQNSYAYMLEGFDRDWVYTGANRFGRYANLPGGSYTLRAKAANNDGVWNETGASLRITVIPPFWQTWAFRLLLGLALLAFAGVAYRVRVTSVERRNRWLHRLVEERTREIERRHQELEALYLADEELYRNIDLDDVLQALVDTAVRLLRSDKGALLVWDEKRQHLSARATRGFDPETLPLLTFAPGQGVAGTVGVSGEPMCIVDVGKDDRPERRIINREGIRAFLQVPVKVGGEIFGVFSADYVAPRPIGETEVRLLTSLAERAALAIQNAQIFEQTQAQAIVEERSRLARELHDAVTQTLFSASLLAEALPGVYAADPEEGNQLLGELRQLSRGALAEMRTLLMELRPSALIEANMEDLLRQLGEAASGREGIPVEVVVDNPCSLPPDVHIALYRIAQEALNNAIKHSRATRISIRLSRQPSNGASNGDGKAGWPKESVVLTVQDNGRGFDPQRTPSNHLGLGIMRERAESIGASLAIESQPGGGAQITACWEFEPAAPVAAIVDGAPAAPGSTIPATGCGAAAAIGENAPAADKNR